MDNVLLIILLFSLAVALLGVAAWIYQLISRKGIYDPSPGKGSDALGILYSFTLGMMPWKKESAKLHPVVYLRGIIFHLGIFAGILALIITIFHLTNWYAVNLALGILLGTGAVSGIAAIIARATDPMLRPISRPDDYISPALITLFMLSGGLHLLVLPGAWHFYIVTSILCLYLPWSKVRHCVYFFFLRGKVGALAGHRGMLRAQEAHARQEIR
jgi:hypothetical protein